MVEHHVARQVTSFVTAVATRTVQQQATPTANVQLLALTTTLVISNYPSGAPQPLAVEYFPFSDGSLITSQFITDFVSDKFRLVVLGLLLMLFCSNSATSFSYLRRVKLKSKALFYYLLGSQLCGIVAVVSLLSPFFILPASCRVYVSAKYFHL